MKHVSSTTCYLQGNGQVKSTNKVLWTLLTKLVSENRTYWDEHVSTMLFSYKTTYKVITNTISISIWITSINAHKIRCFYCWWK
jgi:hypothetical protein